MNNIPPRIIVDGDTNKARGYIGQALSQMRILDNAMSFQSLKQGVRRVWLSADVYVECSRIFNDKTCMIWARPLTQVIDLPISVPASGIFLAYGYWEETAGFNWQRDLSGQETDPNKINVPYGYTWPLTNTYQSDISFTYDFVTVIVTRRQNLIYNDLSTYYSAQILYNGSLIDASRDMNLLYNSKERSWIDFGVVNDSPSFGCDITLVTTTNNGIEESFYSVSLCGTARDTRLFETTPNIKRQIFDFDIKLVGGKYYAVNTTNRVYELPDSDNSYVLLGCKITDDGTEVVYHKSIVIGDIGQDFITVYNAKYNSWRDDKKIAEFDYSISGARLVSQESAIETWPDECENITQGTQVKKILWNFFKKEAVYILSESTTTSFKHEVLTENPYYLRFANGTSRAFHPGVAAGLGVSPTGDGSYFEWPGEVYTPFVESDVVIANAETNIVLPDYFIGETVIDGGSILYIDTEYGMCNITMPYNIDDRNYWYASILWYDKGERKAIENNAVDYSFERAVIDISGEGLCVFGKKIKFKSKEAEQTVYDDYGGIISGEIDWERIGDRDYMRHPWQVAVVDNVEEILIQNSPIEEVSLSTTFPYITYVKAVLLHTLDNIVPPAIVYAREEYKEDGITIKSDGIRGRELYMIDANGVKTDIGKDIKVSKDTTNSQWERAFFFQIKH